MSQVAQSNKTNTFPVMVFLNGKTSGRIAAIYDIQYVLLAESSGNALLFAIDVAISQKDVPEDTVLDTSGEFDYWSTSEASAYTPDGKTSLYVEAVPPWDDCFWKNIQYGFWIEDVELALATLLGWAKLHVPHALSI